MFFQQRCSTRCLSINLSSRLGGYCTYLVQYEPRDISVVTVISLVPTINFFRLGSSFHRRRVSLIGALSKMLFFFGSFTIKISKTTSYSIIIVSNRKYREEDTYVRGTSMKPESFLF
jgi:hypothetical protein